MKTIKRKPEWPEWAEYYAKDQNGCAYVYSCIPYRDEDPDQLNEWEYIGHIALAADNKHKTTCRNWKSSLRKIEDLKKSEDSEIVQTVFVSKVKEFTPDELVSIQHALDHLKANKIADENYTKESGECRGWYRGSRKKYIERHKKSMELLLEILKGDKT